MESLSEKNFGLLIAYILPGFIAVNGIGSVSPRVAQWLAVPPTQPTISGFLYVLVGALAAGLVVSAIRWLVVDTLHRAMGVKSPSWDFSQLDKKLDAFHALVISHYRYYQFYANTLVAIPVWLGCRAAATGDVRWPELALFLILETVLFFGSRDSLRKYYSRSEDLLRGQTRLIVSG